MRVLRLPAIRLIFSVMALCSEEQPNKCNKPAIHNSLHGRDLEAPAMRGSLRFRCGNTTTERPIFQTCGHGETDEDIVTRNSRRGSKFVRKTRQEETVTKLC